MMNQLAIPAVSAFDEIKRLEAKIQELRGEQLRVLEARREELWAELKSIDKKISVIVGNSTPSAGDVESVNRKQRRRRRKSGDDNLFKTEILKAMAEHGATGLSIPEMSGYIDRDAQRIRNFLASNPKLLKRQGAGRGKRYFLP